MMRTNDEMMPLPNEGVSDSGEDDGSFEELLEQYVEPVAEREIGELIRARVVDVKKEYVLLDVGDKAEGIVDIREFVDFRGNVTVAPGDEVEVVILGRDSETGQVRLSHRKAKQRSTWARIVEAHEKNYTVLGVVKKVTPKGLLVDVGIPAFMPASQVDIHRVENLASFVGQEVEAYVIDVDNQRQRAVLSRRKKQEEDLKRKRAELLASLEEGATVTGKVKNITEHGVFVDLGGVDALVPREEVAWEKRVDPAEVLKVGYNYKFKVIGVNRERERVTLSRRQLKPDPWEKIEQNYPLELVVTGTVINLTPTAAYVVLEDGLEGRIHRDHLSWALTVRKPSDILKEGDTVKAMVIGYDHNKRLIELSLKQITMDPWLEVESKYPVGSRVKVKVMDVVDYGAFVQLDETTKGLIHVTDMSYDRNFKNPKKLVSPGDEIEAVVLKIDKEARRINLGIKQLEDDPFETFLAQHPENSVVTGTVKNVTDFGVFVELAPRVEGLLHKSQWDRHRVEKLEDVVKPGDTVTAKIIKVDHEDRKISLSRRQYLLDEERRQVEKYTKQEPVDAKINLGELLGNVKPKLE
ncbi:MAG: S1 RNA-binding domain-containing protein [Candidatus Sumerlaea chitinivorans]|jgi:small subunit ribosomal protein S1|uniref:30S ribosomal protein S1 n=1 Tax=Sumerlaea chitinivorans TaxID=2250252 RepID=A0A2Z4Y9W3_SUMC1|nr:SSU ribosomal protein S1p [Candidatus Sumerlaea chitinivorans]MCX7963599.1 S1 RNA-binding domain-containing protein [Candidatus Sumerlaea chitinivorans]